MTGTLAVLVRFELNLIVMMITAFCEFDLPFIW